VQRWQRSVVAAAAAVGALGVGVALRTSAGGDDQQVSLTAAPGGDGYGFGVRAADVDGLYPGAERRLVLTLTNPYAFDLTVTGLRSSLVTTSRPGCDPVAENLELHDFAGRLPVRVDGRDSREVGFVPMRMPNTVVDACQQATFTIAVTADAARDSR
jgi:hypothetical protein